MLRYDETIFLKLSRRDFIKVQTIFLAIAANFTDLLVNNLASKSNSTTSEYVYWALRSNFSRGLEDVRFKKTKNKNFYLRQKANYIKVRVHINSVCVTKLRRNCISVVFINVVPLTAEFEFFKGRYAKQE